MAEVSVAGSDLDLVELALTVRGLRLRPSDTMVLTDPELTPVALLSADGTVTPLQPLAPRPELALDGVIGVTDPVVASTDAALVFDALPTRAQLAVVDSMPGEKIAWIALTGRGRVGVQPGVLLGAVRAAAAVWAAKTGRSAVVAALPWTVDARPERFTVPDPLADAEALVDWLTRSLGLTAAVVLGQNDEHRLLADLEVRAAEAARKVFPPEVLGFHRTEREGGLVILLTGLSGSGKSTLAHAVAARLVASGSVVSLLDGDEVRQLLSAGLGFDAEGRVMNVRRISWVAAQVAKAGGVAIAALIAPFEAGRAEMRAMAEEVGARFLLVHVSTPLAVCEARDRKGLYAAAREGRIADFTGISSPYEVPSDADVEIDASATGIEDAATAVLGLLQKGTR